MPENPATKRFTIPIGPQHPALKEPISLRMTVEGEVIRDADLRLGYNHRGMEKLAEEMRCGFATLAQRINDLLGGLHGEEHKQLRELIHRVEKIEWRMGI